MLEYDSPLTSDTTADRVWGQFGSFTSAVCNNSDGGTRVPVNIGSLCNPSGLALDAADDLYVADAGNNRVLKYNAPPVSAADAAAVAGQMLFTTATANLVDGRGFHLSAAPSGMAIDRSVSPNRVYLVDPGNNRVLAWSSVSAFVTHAPANLVFGQGSVFTGECNQGAAEASAATLCMPRDVTVDSEGNVYIADIGNNRVLEYDTPFSHDTIADRVYGQHGSFSGRAANAGGISAATLALPAGVAVDTTGALYVSELSNSRVLIFNHPLASTTADQVLGQAGSFATNACNLGGTASAGTLCLPRGLALDKSDNLYVADFNNSRVLEYNAPVLSGALAHSGRRPGQQFHHHGLRPRRCQRAKPLLSASCSAGRQRQSVRGRYLQQPGAGVRSTAIDRYHPRPGLRPVRQFQGRVRLPAQPRFPLPTRRRRARQRGQPLHRRRRRRPRPGVLHAAGHSDADVVCRRDAHANRNSRRNTDTDEEYYSDTYQLPIPYHHADANSHAVTDTNRTDGR